MLTYFSVFIKPRESRTKNMAGAKMEASAVSPAATTRCHKGSISEIAEQRPSKAHSFIKVARTLAKRVKITFSGLWKLIKGLRLSKEHLFNKDN